jgi:hypothetical protein
MEIIRRGSTDTIGRDEQIIADKDRGLVCPDGLH